VLRSAALPIVLLVGACVHRSQEQQILAAFGPLPVSHADQADTAVASKCGAPFARVAMIKGDTAIVAVSEDCAATPLPPRPGTNFGPGGVLRFETDYLVVRVKGRWRVDRPVSRAS